MYLVGGRNFVRRPMRTIFSAWEHCKGTTFSLRSTNFFEFFFQKNRRSQYTSIFFIFFSAAVTCVTCHECH